MLHLFRLMLNGNQQPSTSKAVDPRLPTLTRSAGLEHDLGFVYQQQAALPSCLQHDDVEAEEASITACAEHQHGKGVFPLRKH
ncbi:hypothetical protein MHYP_G00295240 [Metynnis hypsauchen]